MDYKMYKKKKRYQKDKRTIYSKCKKNRKKKSKERK